MTWILIGIIVYLVIGAVLESTDKVSSSPRRTVMTMIVWLPLLVCGFIFCACQAAIGD